MRKGDMRIVFFRTPPSPLGPCYNARLLSRNKENTMESEWTNRAEAIKRRIVQLRDSL